MALEIANYQRKVFVVEGTKVTEDNLEEVASWCEGEVLKDRRDQSFVKVPIVGSHRSRLSRAFVGDWVLRSEVGFKVYTQNSFDKCFEAV